MEAVESIANSNLWHNFGPWGLIFALFLCSCAGLLFLQFRKRLHANGNGNHKLNMYYQNKIDRLSKEFYDFRLTMEKKVTRIESKLDLLIEKS